MITNPERRKFLVKMACSTASILTLASAGFLLGKGFDQPNPSLALFLRPPGALPEKEFLARCIRCQRCADACPNRAIVAFTEDSGSDHSALPSFGERGTPVIFPRRQACMLCNKIPTDKLLCTKACPTGALKIIKKTPESIIKNVKMGTAVVDKKLCYSYNGASCGVCVKACPLEGKALTAGLWEKPIVDPKFCVGCGLCERACVRYPHAIKVVPKRLGIA